MMRVTMKLMTMPNEMRHTNETIIKNRVTALPTMRAVPPKNRFLTRITAPPNETFYHNLDVEGKMV
jgi:hypothetical protein